MAAQEQGSAFVAWGVITGGIAFITAPTSADYSLESEFSEAKGSDGEADAYCHYNPTEKFTVTGYSTSVTLPAIGDVVSPTNASHSSLGGAGGRAFSVAAVRVRESNTDWATLEVDLYRTPSITPA